MNMDDLEVPLFQETSKYFPVKIRYPVSIQLTFFNGQKGGAFRTKPWRMAVSSMPYLGATGATDETMAISDGILGMGYHQG